MKLLDTAGGFCYVLESTGPIQPSQIWQIPNLPPCHLNAAPAKAAPPSTRWSWR
jgi:hypothetical protein